MKKNAMTKLTQILKNHTAKKLKKNNIDINTIQKIIDTINLTDLFYSVGKDSQTIRFSLDMCWMTFSGNYCGRVGKYAEEPIDAHMSIKYTGTDIECKYKCKYECNYYDMAISDFWECAESNDNNYHDISNKIDINDINVAFSMILKDHEINIKPEYITQLCACCLDDLLYKNLKRYSFIGDS